MLLPRLRSRTFKVHVGIIGLLVALHLLQESVPLLGRGRIPLGSAFDLVEEMSIPNFFSALALAVTSAAAALVAQQHGGANSPLRRGWYLIAILLLFIAFDEGSNIHDRLSLAVQERLNLGGVFYIGWILPYLILLAFCSVALLRVALGLPTEDRLRLFVASLVYVVSAMGMEAAEALLFENAAAGGTLRSVNQYLVNAQPRMILLVTIEEAGEMLGVALALRAILIYLEQELGVTAFSIERPVAALELENGHV